MPELPPILTIAETLPRFEVTVVNHIVVRGGTPQENIARLNTALVKVLADPFLNEAMRIAGRSPTVSSRPEKLGEILRPESAKRREVLEKAGIRLE